MYTVTLRLLYYALSKWPTDHIKEFSNLHYVLWIQKKIYFTYCRMLIRSSSHENDIIKASKVKGNTKWNIIYVWQWLKPTMQLGKALRHYCFNEDMHVRCMPCHGSNRWKTIFFSFSSFSKFFSSYVIRASGDI